MSLPIALQGKDVAGQAQTGTGKTIAFLVALFNHLMTHPKRKPDETQPRALVMAPPANSRCRLLMTVRQLPKAVA